MDYTGLIQRLRAHENPLIAEAADALEVSRATIDALEERVRSLQYEIHDKQLIIQNQALENQALRNRSRRGV